MAKKDPAFLFYPKDWLEGTAEMHPNEKGVYIDLLCYQHQKGDLPTDIQKLARLVRLSVLEFTEIWESISPKFTTKDERMFNVRLNNEVNERSIRAHKNKIVGWFSAYLRTHELTKAQYNHLKKTFKTDDFNNIPNERLNECINDWCNECLKSIENANADANNNIVYSYKDFLSIFNLITKREFRGDKDSKTNFELRIKDGYTKEQITKAITSASKDKYLVDGNWLTPEYITRAKILEKWSNAVIQPQVDHNQQQQVQKPNSPFHQGLMGN